LLEGEDSNRKWMSNDDLEEATEAPIKAKGYLKIRKINEQLKSSGEEGKTFDVELIKYYGCLYGQIIVSKEYLLFLSFGCITPQTEKFKSNKTD
jgi:hypothetical protein